MSDSILLPPSNDDLPQVPTAAPANDGASRSRASDGPFGRRNPDPGPGFRASFTEELKRRMTQAVQTAYRVVQDRHEESLGFDAHTFGYCVYRVGVFHLRKLCAGSGGSLELIDELTSLFRFKVDDYTCAFYKVGSSAETNIWEAFPTSENGTMSVTDEGYPFLVGFEDAMLDDVAASRYAVLAHVGNPTSGLCALYLCIPIEGEQGRVKRWGYAECIYDAKESGRGSLPPPPPMPRPSEDKIDPLVPEIEPEAEVVVTAKDEA